MAAFYGEERVRHLEAGGWTVELLYNRLEGAWGRYTCAPRLRHKWSEGNKSLGQCSITAFVAQDIFGGQVYAIPSPGGGMHCYNVAQGQAFDLTSGQFGGLALDYSGGELQDRRTHLDQAEKRQRYLALRQALGLGGEAEGRGAEGRESEGRGA